MTTYDERLIILEREVSELRQEMARLRGQPSDSIIPNVLRNIRLGAEEVIDKTKDATHKIFDTIKTAVEKKSD
jgi:hypothetical protein